ncbi:hypothetical protein ACQPZK_24025 [Micromonospora sp. CA-249363]|uniref:hypothetical protein n=1 Tax=Micromonospora sp. CA-249363 TaxID=3239963 RepID=UPI003D940A0F
MSIGEIKAILHEADRSLSDAATTVKEIGTQLDEATGLALASLHDSQHTEANEARADLISARREVELTLRVITAVKDNAASYRESLG